jgi:hypothetical protein
MVLTGLTYLFSRLPSLKHDVDCKWMWEVTELPALLSAAFGLDMQYFHHFGTAEYKLPN